MAMPMRGITVLIRLIPLITLDFLITITTIIEAIDIIGMTADQTGVIEIAPIGEGHRAGEIPVIALVDRVSGAGGVNN